MPYRCDLNTGQQIYLDNQGDKTLITVASSGPGQQQQSSSSLQTGQWTEVPQVAKINGGVVIRCVSAQGTYTIQVQGSQIGQVASAVDWNAAQTVAVHAIDHMPGQGMPDMQAMQPMQPMQPMRMGNMEMSTNPMEMRMGNMAMRMGNTPEQTRPQKRFCTQCGAQVSPDDRFCGSCGHQLQ